MKSETKEIRLPEGAAKIPINLLFSRLTTIYRLDDGSYQRKSSVIRLLELPLSEQTATQTRTHLKDL